MSTINSPLYFLAKFLHEIIYTSVLKSKSHIKNSFDLVNRFQSILTYRKQDKHFDLISLDVVSLFTNVSIDLTLSSIRLRWSSISSKINIPMDQYTYEFLTAIQFVLDSTYFKFNDIFYKQTFGMPMGSLLSPIISLYFKI